MADPIENVRAFVEEAFAGLDACVTRNVAWDRCRDALEVLRSQTDLMIRFERPRQEKVKADRAAAAAAKAAEAAQAAAALKARTEKRKKARR